MLSKLELSAAFYSWRGKLSLTACEIGLDRDFCYRTFTTTSLSVACSLNSSGHSPIKTFINNGTILKRQCYTFTSAD